MVAGAELLFMYLSRLSAQLIVVASFLLFIILVYSYYFIYYLTFYICTLK